MFSPFIKNATVTIGATEFSDEASNVRFAQATTTATFTGVSGLTVSDTTLGAWTVNLTIGEDWELPGSLANYIYENEGLPVEMVFKPKGGGTVTWTATVTPTLAGIGGAAGVASGSATWASTRPVKGTVVV